MKKTLKRSICFFFALCLCIGLVSMALPLSASAAGNPYPYTQTVGGVVTRPCTWYAWQCAYERLGIALPKWGDAINWLSGARNSGYQTGNTAAVNSIAVYSEPSHSYGHVAYVTAVNGNEMTVDEAGRTDKVANNGIANGQPSRAIVGQGRGHGFSSTLLGFIYLKGSPTPASITANFNSSATAGETTAKIEAQLTVSGASISQVNQVGAKIYDAAGNELFWKEEQVSYNTSHINIWYEIGSGKEINVPLTKATTYYYLFYANISGKTYYDAKKSFKTTGTVDVSSVSLSRTTLNMLNGETSKLTATVAPSNATNKTVTWSSSDSSVASVSGGMITAKKAGTTTITAKAGGKTATCKVTVSDPTVAVTSVSINKSSINMTVGDTAALTATVSPSNATNKTVVWSSSDSSVASVSSGTVTAKKAGSATITATAGGKSAICKVTVSSPAVSVVSVTLDKSSVNMTVGNSTSLTATVAPSNATNKSVTWSSSDSSVASVSAGTVTAKKAGSATITATAGGKNASCTVTVKESAPSTIAVSSVTLDRKVMVLKEGDTGNLNYTISPSNATNKAVSWNSSDPMVAEVSGGIVKAKKAGTTLITIKAGDKESSCEVTVQEKESSVETKRHGVNCISAKYADVSKDENNWTHLPIDYVLEKGYMAGMSATQFSPNGTVTRSQIVQILFAKEGKPTVVGTKSFNDVAPGMWYSDAIRWASFSNVVSGYPDGSFRPNQPITREQMVTILRAYAGYKGQDITASGNVNSFADAGKISNYALQSVRWAIGKKLISGTGKGIEPQGTATRAQIAVILKAYDTNI